MKLNERWPWMPEAITWTVQFPWGTLDICGCKYRLINAYY